MTGGASPSLQRTKSRRDMKRLRIAMLHWGCPLIIGGRGNTPDAHWLKTVRLRNRRVGQGAAELVFERKASGVVRCRLVRKRGPIQVLIYE
jgi:hypothetical protein